MNCIRLLLLSAFTLTICLNTRAQSFDKKDPIDQSYEDCLRKDTSIANISNCAYVAYAKWNKELEKYYNKIQRELKKAKDKSSFIQSQRAWQAYRDAEFNSYDNMFNRPGDRWTYIRANNRVDIVKARVLQLREYYEILTAKN
jgi:uncharacterized protein YecT (DUF1311 family)